jgi:hypothetical protein
VTGWPPRVGAAASRSDVRVDEHNIPLAGGHLHPLGPQRRLRHPRPRHAEFDTAEPGGVRVAVLREPKNMRGVSLVCRVQGDVWEFHQDRRSVLLAQERRRARPSLVERQVLLGCGRGVCSRPALKHKRQTWDESACTIAMSVTIVLTSLFVWKTVINSRSGILGQWFISVRANKTSCDRTNRPGSGLFMCRRTIVHRVSSTHKYF